MCCIPGKWRCVNGDSRERLMSGGLYCETGGWIMAAQNRWKLSINFLNKKEQVDKTRNEIERFRKLANDGEEESRKFTWTYGIGKSLSFLCTRKKYRLQINIRSTISCHSFFALLRAPFDPIPPLKNHRVQHVHDLSSRIFLLNASSTNRAMVGRARRRERTKEKKKKYVETKRKPRTTPFNIPSRAFVRRDRRSVNVRPLNPRD